MSKRLSLSLLTALILGLLTQLSWAVSGNSVKGKVLFEKQCLFCHGEQGKGDGSMGKSLTPPPADLGAPKIKAKSDEDLLQSIQNGHPPTAMPAFKAQLSEQDIRDVLAYIRTFSK